MKQVILINVDIWGDNVSITSDDEDGDVVIFKHLIMVAYIH